MEFIILLYFVIGILFIYFVIPLLESVLSFLATWLKYKETTYTTKIYKMNKEATKENDAKVVGFVYDDEEDPEEDEEI